jgi:hypothetical protein
VAAWIAASVCCCVATWIAVSISPFIPSLSNEDRLEKKETILSFYHDVMEKGLLNRTEVLAGSGIHRVSCSRFI